MLNKPLSESESESNVTGLDNGLAPKCKLAVI